LKNKNVSMNMMYTVMATSLILFTWSTSALSSSPLLRTIADIPLPGGASRFDYQSLDTQRGRLFIAHMGAGQVVVVDVTAQTVVGVIKELPGVTGVLAVPELHRLYASVSGTGELAVIDEESLHIAARIPAGDFPDGIAYAAEEGQFFISDETGKAVVVISARTNQRVDRIALDGEVGNTQYDPGSHLIFSTVQSRNELVAIDPHTHQIVQRFELRGGRHPHGLLIEASRRTAFIACDGDARLLVFDLDTGRVMQILSTGKEPDVLSFDPGLHRLYVASESGMLSIFEQDGARLKKDGDDFVAPKAHSIMVDPQTHRVYLPLQSIDHHPMLRIMEPVPNH
jgi:DNA-binding beta-propeller fold protein YncE